MNFWPLKLQNFTPYCYYNDFLTPIECDAIKSLGNSFPTEKGMVFGDTNNIQENVEVRKNEIVFFTPLKQFSWVYKKCTDMIHQANAEYFNYDLTLIEPLQYTIYSKLNDHYTEHYDAGAGTPMQRKLSFSIQLDPEDSYEGCDLTFNGLPKNEIIRKQGTIVFFPSFILHTVTPLLSGTRRSLVGWICGPDFK
jgi:PKHD-type hydroxylase